MNFDDQKFEQANRDITHLERLICVGCFDQSVPVGWTIAPDCNPTDHPFCAECIVEFMWREYTADRLPFKCPVCGADLNIDLPEWYEAVGAAWPPGKRLGQPQTPMRFAEFQADVQRRVGVLAEQTCVACLSSNVPTGWTISPNCTTYDHSFCADCLAEYLWSEYCKVGLPFKCYSCSAPLSLDLMPAIRRAVEEAWPPGKRDGLVRTDMTFAEFEVNVAWRQREAKEMWEDFEGSQWALERLQLLQNTDWGPIEGVTGDVPLTRACPRCRLMIHFDGDCQFVTCPFSFCRHQFCMACLRVRSDHSNVEWERNVPCTVAPIQTLREFVRQDEEMEWVREQLELLQHSDWGPIECVTNEEVPLTRACPKCGLVMHFDVECKYVICPHSACKHRFCFRCLREHFEHSEEELSGTIPCTVAPIQTSLSSK
eukprot:EG_transcript_12770